MADENEFVTRYGAGNAALPDPDTMCAGECEGTGWLPVYFPEGDQRAVTARRSSPVIQAAIAPTVEDYERYYDAWREAEQRTPSEDGWHFVQCLDCGGTGKKKLRGEA